MWSLVLLNLVSAFYLPGLAPVNFCEDVQPGCQSNVTIYVNHLSSDQSVIPYEYHSFDFCIGSEDESPVENLGQVLFGERIRRSPYEVSFLQNKTCSRLCTKKYSGRDTEQKLLHLLKGIVLNYQNNWIVDNMPVTFCFVNSEKLNVCTKGFPMGCYVNQDGNQQHACVLDSRLREPDTYYIFNHHDIEIEYRDMRQEANFLDEKIGGRIIHIKVTPRSIKHSETDLNCGFDAPPLGLKTKDEKTQITYSYSVQWKETGVKWTSRWDYILDSIPHSNVQWASIVNSCFIVLLLSIMVAIILCRALSADITVYNRQTLEEEDVGWKLIHADVFRPPRFSLLLSVFVGAGCQTLFMVCITLVVACLGFLSPANRGALITFGIIFYVLFGIVAGYVSARLYKAFYGIHWKMNVVLTAFLVPGVLFSIFFFTNTILWIKGSSAAVPFGTLLALLGLWLFIQTPLTFIGAYSGFKMDIIPAPVRTNLIAREIPEQSFFTRPLPTMLMGGILPFGCIFIQLFYILNSIWSTHVYYYLFGCLSIVVAIFIVTTSLTTILLAYFHLSAEDYRWTWRGFFNGGSTAAYLFLYCVHFFNTKLSIIGTASVVLYFSYTTIAVFMFFLLSGTIGFLATYAFVWKLFSAIKVD